MQDHLAQMEECPTLGQIAANSPFVMENLKRLAVHNRQEKSGEKSPGAV